MDGREGERGSKKERGNGLIETIRDEFFFFQAEDGIRDSDM